jgi:hypothetical protein
MQWILLALLEVLWFQLEFLKNLKRPFLHVRYRASNTESRKMKTWTTGSVGAVTSDLDAMEMHFLSERCLVTQGANNFMLLN